MISSIVAGISWALDAEFGESCTIYTEEVEQGLEEPCFFIFCLNPTVRHFLGARYFRKNQFCIQYFPACGNKECNAVGERLLWALEYLKVNEDLFHGTEMRYEIADGVMNFFVNYNCFIYRQVLKEDPMEMVDVRTEAKGARSNGN